MGLRINTATDRGVAHGQDVIGMGQSSIVAVFRQQHRNVFEVPVGVANQRAEGGQHVDMVDLIARQVVRLFATRRELRSDALGTMN